MASDIFKFYQYQRIFPRSWKINLSINLEVSFSFNYLATLTKKKQNVIGL